MQVRFLPGAYARSLVRFCRPAPEADTHRPSCYRPRFSVAESTLEAPSIPQAAAADQALPREPAPWTLRAYVSEHPWLSTGVVIVGVSTLLVGWGRTRASFHAHGWVGWGRPRRSSAAYGGWGWGHQPLHGTLVPGAPPPWTPLPYLFTVPFAPFG